jgi:DNA (cytosine-5)-methyltransferase 1
MRTVGFCECDEYCQRVLARHWPGVPIFPDIRELDAERLGWLGRIDLVCAGYPCQPFSFAGSRRAQEDDRHLWPEVSRIIACTRPTWVVCENVAGHISLGLDQVLFDLEGLGYASRPFVIPACAVGANHERARLWIVAHADGSRLQERFVQPGVPREARRDDDGQDAPLDPWRTSEPALVRKLHGIPARVDRVRALGNSVVPQIPELIGRAIMRHA